MKLRDRTDPQDSAPRLVPREIRIEPRDVEILSGLFECRIMQRRPHITEVYFGGKDEAAKKRVTALRRCRYIVEHDPERYKNEKAIYRLAPRGFEALKERGALDRFNAVCGKDFAWRSLEDRHQVSQFTLEHELGVMDLKAALYRAARFPANPRIAEFWSWPQLLSFSAPAQDGSAQTVRPDAFLRLVRESENRELSRMHYIEFDRGSENHDRLVQKVEGYRRYNRSKAFARFLTGAEDGEFTFRVLIVFQRTTTQHAEERLFNCAHALSKMNPPVRSSAWLTTYEEFVADPFARIWICPEDYQRALAGTAFDPLTTDWTPRGRMSARDALVRERIRKRALWPLTNQPVVQINEVRP
jgi:hypothetical protein